VQEASPAVAVTVDNATVAYRVRAQFNTSLAAPDPDLRLFGCKLTYTLDRPSAP
jgi:hypothetical protein